MCALVAEGSLCRVEVWVLCRSGGDEERVDA